MTTALLALLAAGAPAHATETDTAFAVEALPRSDGESQWRGVVDLGGTEELGPWRFSLRTGLRTSDLAAEPFVPELYRLGVGWREGGLDLAAGRLARVDSRGVERIDGATMSVGTYAPLSGAAWAGRLWFPEEWGAPEGFGEAEEGAEELGDTWVVGGELRFSPGDIPSWGAALGTESRIAEGALTQRVHAASDWASLHGHEVGANAEIALPTGEDPFGARAGLRGAVALGPAWAVGAAARWEGLTPAAVPQGASNPMGWIAPDGYGVASATLEYERKGYAAVAEAGVVARPADEGSAGALARVGVALGEGAPVEVYVRGAALGPSMLAGGGAAVRRELGPVDVRADAAVYDLRGLDQENGLVAECRLDAELPIHVREAEDGPAEAFRLRGTAAAGSDRLLAAWVRGGVALVGEFSR